jgi:hypothetical protein
LQYGAFNSYAPQVRRLLAQVPRKQCLFLLYEEPMRALQRLNQVAGDRPPLLRRPTRRNPTAEASTDARLGLANRGELRWLLTDSNRRHSPVRQDQSNINNLGHRYRSERAPRGHTGAQRERTRRGPQSQRSRSIRRPLSSSKSATPSRTRKLTERYAPAQSRCWLSCKGLCRTMPPTSARSRDLEAGRARIRTPPAARQSS